MSFIQKVEANFSGLTWEEECDGYWSCGLGKDNDYYYRGEIYLFDGDYEWSVENEDTGRRIDRGETQTLNEAKKKVESVFSRLKQASQKNKNKKIFRNENLNDLYFEIKDGIASGDDDIAPAASYFEQPRKTKPNAFLIHFTDNPEGIIENGFRGVDLEHIGLTTKYATKSGPYAFGIDLMDTEALESAKEDYGKHAVIFKIKEGLEAYHNTDEYHQVIFDVEDAFDLRVLKDAKDLSVAKIRQASKEVKG